MNNKKKTTNYGNWVPANMIRAGWSITAVLAIVAIVCWLCWRSGIAAGIFGVLCIVICVFTIYMQRCRTIFAFEKGGMMGNVHEHLVEHLAWDGNGTLLDIGCGAGALTIRCAKKFRHAELVGMDYWGKEWNYAKEQCESNAEIEGVIKRVQFQKGDAAHLEFPDETFDAAVSNFVFHEVRSQPDKRQVVREALRVVKKGGVFSFQDMFSQKGLYGDMEEFVRQLKEEGISEIHYIGNLEKKLSFIPKFVTAPWMIKGMGIIYGRK